MHHNSTDRKKHQGSTQESAHSVYTCVQREILPQTHEPSGRGLHFPAALSRSYVVSRSFLLCQERDSLLEKQVSESCLPENSQKLEKQSSETI